VALFFSVAVWLGHVTRAADTTAPVDLAVLKVIPEDALAVVIIPHLDEADAKLSTVSQEMQFPTPQLLPLLKLRAGVQEGLDDHGAAAMVLMPGEGRFTSDANRDRAGVRL